MLVTVCLLLSFRPNVVPVSLCRPITMIMIMTMIPSKQPAWILRVLKIWPLGLSPLDWGWILITATIRWLLCVIVQNLAARLQYHFGLNFRSNNLSSPGDSRGRGAQKPITFSDEQYLVACQFVKFSRNPATDFF